MLITTTNSQIVFKDAPLDVEMQLRQLLSYTDKAKQYQLKRMSKNHFSRTTPAYKQLQKEVDGCLLIKRDDELIIPSGFYHVLLDMNLSSTDKRMDTGKKISLPWKKKPDDMRDYQDEAVSLMVSNWRGLINFATGLGKTLTAVHAIRSIGRRTLIVCPSTSIADQFHDILCAAFGSNRIGYFGNGKKKINDITVGIVGSINNNIDLFKAADLGLVIVDETHHIAATTFYSIATELSSVGRFFGLTATDYRADGKDIMITAGCGPVLIRRDVVWGVQNNWLAQPYFIIRKVDTQGKDFRDDKLKNYKAHILNDKTMKDRIQSDCKKFMDAGKVVLCLVDEVEHGKELSAALGIPFATGDDKDSSEYVKQLNAGKIAGLIGTDSKISEGTDTKLVDVLILANFVASKGAVMQCIGRALRKQGTKTHAVILDYIPEGSAQLTRHAQQRLSYYKEITSNIQVV